MDFLENTLLPILGERIFERSPGDPRTLVQTSSGLTIKGFGQSGDIHFRWLDQIAQPYFRIESNGNRTIFIPKSFQFDLLKDRGQDFVYRALRGHSLNPYVKSETARQERLAHGGADFIPKGVQQQGIEAGVAGLKRGDSSFLFVGPTGVGKTKVVEGLLGHLIENTKQKVTLAKATQSQLPPNIHIVFADKTDLVTQLEGDIRRMGFAEDIEVYRWGNSLSKNDGDHPHDDSTYAPSSIQELITHAQGTRRPIVLVTTIQTLISRAGKYRLEGDTRIRFEQDKLALLKDHVRSITIDEAHHAGAPGTLALLDALRGIIRDDDGSIRIRDSDPNNQIQVIGVSATPTRRDMDLIGQVFDGHAFYAYLDDPATYLTQGGKAERGVGDLLKQLETAIEKGEAHPVTTQFLNPRAFDNSEERFFIQAKKSAQEEETSRSRGARFVINPNHHDSFYDAVLPTFNRHEHLFVACSTISEAEDLMKYFAERGPVGPTGKKHTMGYIHSKMDRATREATFRDFKSGKISVLFNVGIMDEGIDIPTLSAYIDTNRHTDPKELIQRIGRIVRLSEGKTRISEVVSFEEIDDLQTAQALNRLNAIGKRHWGDSLADGQGEGDSPSDPTPNLAVKPKTPEPTKARSPNVLWTTESLQARQQELFKSRLSAFPKLIAAYEKFKTLAKDKAKAQEAMDALGNMPKSERKIHDDIYRLANAQGEEGEFFIYLVEKTPPEIRPILEAYVRELRDREAIMKDPVRLAEWARKRRSVPVYNADQTAEYNAIANAIAHNTNNPLFLATLTSLTKSPPDIGQDLAHITKTRVSDPLTLLGDVSVFNRHYSRLPDPQALGFEGALGQGLKNFVDKSDEETFYSLLDAHLGHDEEVLHKLLTARDLKTEAKKESIQPDLTKSAEKPRVPQDFIYRNDRNVANAIDRLQKLIQQDPDSRDQRLLPHRQLLSQFERLQKLHAEMKITSAKNQNPPEAIVLEREEILRNTAALTNLALLAGIKTNQSDTVRITLKPEYVVGMEGAERIIDIYAKLATDLGYEMSAQRLPDSYVLTVKATDQARFSPALAFYFESGKHRIQYRNNGQVHTNVVEISLSDNPKSNRDEVRFYRMQDTLVITDNPSSKNTAFDMSDQKKRGQLFESAVRKRLLLELTP